MKRFFAKVVIVFSLVFTLQSYFEARGLPILETKFLQNSLMMTLTFAKLKTVKISYLEKIFLEGILK